MTILIVVGVDCSGKDTLINELHKRTGYKILRGSSFELTHDKSEEELFESFINLVDDDNIILNRYMYCNHVYAPLFNDYAQIKEEDVRFIERELSGDALVIHLWANEDVIKNRFEIRGEYYVDVGKINDILDGYERILEDSKLDVMSFNTGIKSAHDIADIIMEYLDY